MPDVASRCGRQREIVRALWLARGPVLIGLWLVLYPAAALHPEWGRPIRGHFDLSPARGFLAGLVAGLAALTIIAAGRTLAAYGPGRTGAQVPAGARIAERLIVLAVLLVAPTLAVTAFVSFQFGERAWLVVLAATGLGAVIAMVAATLTWWLIERVTDTVRYGGVSRRQQLLRWLAGRDVGANGYFLWDLGRIRLLRGHRLLLVLLAAGLIVYLVFGVVGARRPHQGPVSTLAYFMILTQLLALGIGAATFFLDRFRWPPLLSVAVLALLLYSLLPHHLAGVVALEGSPPAPHAVLRPSPPLVAVAAGGGGLLSAAWTVRVLTGLEEQCRAACGTDAAAFARSIGVVSAASGGSLGTMFFAEAMEKGLGESALAEARTRAGTSYQDALAFGLLYRDPFRWWPRARRYADRAQALEHAWNDGADLDKPLSAWSERAVRGDLPALIFNATLMHTRERLLFSTTRLTPRPGRRTLQELDPHWDLPIVTAVRLSATAPVVTPAAVPDADRARRYLIADGGYADNEGVLSLVEWLDEALEGRPGGMSRVLILRISLGGAERVPARPGAFVPDFAAQQARNELALDQFAARWRRAGLVIDAVEFPFDGSGPLAWHLTAHDRQKIEDRWRELAAGPRWEAVRRSLVTAGAPDPLMDRSSDHSLMHAFAERQ